MKAICRINTPLPEEPQIAPYRVCVGKEYDIFGIALSACKLYLLVRDEDNGPMWLPARLFAINDRTVPADWKIDIRKDTHEIQMIVGYDHLVDDPLHYSKLSERFPEDVWIFEKQYRALYPRPVE